MRQLILQNEPDSSGNIIINDTLYRYLVKVLRLSVGNTFPVVLPKSGTVQVQIESINTAKKELVLKKTANISSDSLSPIGTEIILLQWVLKGSKIDTVIRQATEAGVSCIMPVFGDFSVVKSETDARHERYKRVIREARQQSGSSVTTEIKPAAPLSTVLQAVESLVPHEQTAFCMFNEKMVNEAQSLHKVLTPVPSHIVLAIGAEGGISADEYQQMHTAGFQHVHFDTNILRADTAALYAIAAAQTIINEADIWELV